jgi:undecaprenyl-diphosphatase
MIEFLLNIDTQILLFVNRLNTPFLDEFMWQISGRIIWIPLYLLIFYLAYRKMGLKKALFYLVFVFLCFAFSDLFSNQIKEIVQRFRPSHNEDLQEKLHLYKIAYEEYYMGGKYGFFSAHASNFFVVASTFFLILRNHYQNFALFLFFIACMVSLSRVYLAVHYPSDILAGAIFGTSIAYIFYKFAWKKIFKQAI